jgi:hypothetical protein
LALPFSFTPALATIFTVAAAAVSGTIALTVVVTAIAGTRFGAIVVSAPVSGVSGVPVTVARAVAAFAAAFTGAVTSFAGAIATAFTGAVTAFAGAAATTIAGIVAPTVTWAIAATVARPGATAAVTRTAANTIARISWAGLRSSIRIPIFTSAVTNCRANRRGRHISQQRRQTGAHCAGILQRCRKIRPVLKALQEAGGDMRAFTHRRVIPTIRCIPRCFPVANLGCRRCTASRQNPKDGCGNPCSHPYSFTLMHCASLLSPRRLIATLLP